MKEVFTPWEPRVGKSAALLQAAIDVIEDYESQGYQLTVRQLYYQLVTQNILRNNLQEYKRLEKSVNKGRLGGHIDWDSIVDRARAAVKPPEWSDPTDILDSAARSYRLDRWEGQRHYVEVWCEKDALSGIIAPVCSRYHVRYMGDRGYLSSTAVYDGAQRFTEAMDRGRDAVLIYLGDHDPSGLDMSRDIEARLYLMTWSAGVEVARLALNMDQVTEHQPPPNPAKLQDTRYNGYVEEHGLETWELDALNPALLDALLSGAIERRLDRDLWNVMLKREAAGRESIRLAGEWLLRRQTGRPSNDEWPCGSDVIL